MVTYLLLFSLSATFIAAVLGFWAGGSPIHQRVTEEDLRDILIAWAIGLLVIGACSVVVATKEDQSIDMERPRAIAHATSLSRFTSNLD